MGQQTDPFCHQYWESPGTVLLNDTNAYMTPKCRQTEKLSNMTFSNFVDECIHADMRNSADAADMSM